MMSSNDTGSINNTTQESISNNDKINQEDLEILFMKNYNEDQIEKRLLFLEQLQKKIEKETKELQFKSKLLRANSRFEKENDNDIEIEDTEASSDQIEILNPEDNRPIEFSLVTSDSIAEPNNDNMLLSSEADFNMDIKNEGIVSFIYFILFFFFFFLQLIKQFLKYYNMFHVHFNI